MNYSVIINLTQHDATDDQIKAGVVDLPHPYKEKLKDLLTFDELPTCDEVKARAKAVKELVLDVFQDKSSPIRKEVKAMLDAKDDGFKDFNIAFMVGGAPFLMKPLIDELEKIGYPVFAFSKRVVDEVKQADGSVRKVTIFKHEGFIPAC